LEVKPICAVEQAAGGYVLSQGLPKTTAVLFIANILAMSVMTAFVLPRRPRSINTARMHLAKMIQELVEHGLIVINPRTRQQLTPEMLDAWAHPSRRKS
jgi:hypothetical protein